MNFTTQKKTEKSLDKKSTPMDKNDIEITQSNPGSKRLIKKIVQINPKNIKDLGIAQQIAEAVSKLHANNNPPSSINIDLSPAFKSPEIYASLTNKNRSKPTPCIPSTSKASIEKIPFDTIVKSSSEKLKSLNVKNTLNQMLLERSKQKSSNLNKTNVDKMKIIIEQRDLLLKNEEKLKTLKTNSKSKYDNQTKIIKKSQKNKNKDEVNVVRQLSFDNTNTDILTNEEYLLNTLLDESVDEININDQDKCDKTNIKVNEQQSKFSINEDKNVSPIITEKSNSKPKVLKGKILNEFKSSLKTIPDKLTKNTQKIPVRKNKEQIKSESKIPSHSNNKYNKMVKSLSDIEVTNSNVVDEHSKNLKNKETVVSTGRGKQIISPKTINQYDILKIKEPIKSLPLTSNKSSTNDIHDTMTNNTMNRKRKLSSSIVSENMKLVQDKNNSKCRKVDSKIDQEKDSIPIVKIKDNTTKEFSNAVDFLVSLGDSTKNFVFSDSDSSSDMDDSDGEVLDLLKPKSDNESTVNVNEIQNSTFNEQTDVNTKFFINQNQIIMQSPVPKMKQQEIKPLIIENKILIDDEKIDLKFLRNIPHFKTPTQASHSIGETIILTPCENIRSENEVKFCNEQVITKLNQHESITMGEKKEESKFLKSNSHENIQIAEFIKVGDIINLESGSLSQNLNDPKQLINLCNPTSVVAFQKNVNVPTNLINTNKLEHLNIPSITENLQVKKTVLPHETRFNSYKNLQKSKNLSEQNKIASYTEKINTINISSEDLEMKNFPQIIFSENIESEKKLQFQNLQTVENPCENEQMPRKSIENLGATFEKKTHNDCSPIKKKVDKINNDFFLEKHSETSQIINTSSCNSSLADSLEMEEPFFGFSEADLINLENFKKQDEKNIETFLSEDKKLEENIITDGKQLIPENENQIKTFETNSLNDNQSDGCHKKIRKNEIKTIKSQLSIKNFLKKLEPNDDLSSKSNQNSENILKNSEKTKSSPKSFNKKLRVHNTEDEKESVPLKKRKFRAEAAKLNNPNNKKKEEKKNENLIKVKKKNKIVSSLKNLNELKDSIKPKKLTKQGNSSNDNFDTMINDNIKLENITMNIKNKQTNPIKESSTKINPSTDDNESPKNPRSYRTIHPRLLLIDNRNELEKTEKNSKELPVTLKSSTLKCGMCKEIVKKQYWDEHKNIHYGIGWFTNEQQINLSSYAAVLRALTTSFNENKKKSINCRLCSKSYLSALGLLLHLEICGLTDEQKRSKNKITCTKCNGEYAKKSFSNHIKICPANKKQSQTLHETVVGNSGRLKRQSMLKAENKFKDLNKMDYDDFIKTISGADMRQYNVWKKEIINNGETKCVGEECDLKFMSYAEIRAHAKVCKSLLKKMYHCTKCKYKNDCIDTVRQHIKKKHAGMDFSGSDEDNYENDSSSTDASEYKSDKEDIDEHLSNKSTNCKNTSKSTNFKYKLVNDNHDKSRTKYTEWTKYFFKMHFSNEILFTKMTVNCEISKLSLDLFKPKNQLSMKFSNTKTDINRSFNCSTPSTDWFEIENFKSMKFPNEELIYIGGPITSLKWIPTPKDNKIESSQYIAITYKKKFNKFVHNLNPEKIQTLILIYKVGNLDEFRQSNKLGNFEYGIAFDSGPIHDIDFLPSGGYCLKLNRLGLIAVASTKNDILIYSLPIKAPKSCDNNNNSLNIIDLKLGIQLKLNLQKSQNDKNFNIQCTKIVWSRAKYHNIIVSGYSNGFIAIWNITEDDNLNLFHVDGIQTFLPINYFKISTREITGLNLHYNSEQPRWLMACSMNRIFKVLDIEDPTHPILLNEDVAKSFLSSSTWPYTFQNPTYSTTDDLYQSSNVRVISPLMINYKVKRYARQSGGINDTDFNHWNFVMAVGGNNGDFSIELVNNQDSADIPKMEKKFNSYTDLIRLDGKPIKNIYPINIKKALESSETKIEQLTYFDNDFRNKYGLIFGPLTFMKRNLMFLNQSRNPPINMKSYVQINRVGCNDNENGRQLFALGYENGFVRILYNNIDNIN